MTMTQTELDDFVRKIADSGKITQAGWTDFRYISIPVDASDIQIEEMRNAFFAGAQHLFGSIMQALIREEAEVADGQ